MGGCETARIETFQGFSGASQEIRNIRVSLLILRYDDAYLFRYLRSLYTVKTDRNQRQKSLCFRKTMRWPETAFECAGAIESAWAFESAWGFGERGAAGPAQLAGALDLGR